MKFLARKFAVTTLLLGLSMAASAEQNPLVAERWKTRPVVVVVPRKDDSLLAKIQATLEAPAGREAFREREMVLYTVVSGKGSRNGKPLPAEQTRALLQALQMEAPRPATLVLVGKDGEIKMTEGADVDLQTVFAEIDRMPMRQKR